MWSKPSLRALMRCCGAGDDLLQAWLRVCLMFRAHRQHSFR